MSDSSSSFTPLAGRILMSVLFLISGFFKIGGYSQMVAYSSSKGLPMASVAIACAAVIELAGGLAIIAGFQTKIAAWLLFLYLIPVTFLFHNFWAMQGVEQQQNMIDFLKNVSIMGGLVILATYGAGPYSVDHSRAKA
ncbi:MAG TPA: DoxX family protein [Candidatus Acidoferrales bacterium]|jgi:putative oxidoreductase|nr:DoxX family protein [Candidatus Acidoferrales bacterium]